MKYRIVAIVAADERPELIDLSVWIEHARHIDDVVHISCEPVTEAEKENQ